MHTSASMNYYPFHIGDYLSATRHLSWEEDAAYRRLLDTYYTTEKPLPPDLRACCRLVLAQTDSQREAVRVVLEEFFEQTAEGWVNGRADIEIAAMRAKQEKQRDKAMKRWGNAAPHAPAMPQHNETDAAASENHADAMPPTPTPTPTPTPKREKHTAAASLLPDADVGLLADWQVIRKAKRLGPITQTVADALRTEAAKAAMSLDDALRICCKRGWGGFEAGWLSRNATGPPRETAKEASTRRMMEGIRGTDSGSDSGTTIDGTAERLA